MAKKKRVHLDSGMRGTLTVAACGWRAVEVTTALELVDCRTCLGVDGREERRQAKKAMDVRTELQRLLLGRGRPTLPEPKWNGIVTPEVWRSSCLRREHGDECGTCVVCERLKILRILGELDGTYERERTVGVVQLEGVRGPRWGSAERAVEYYATTTYGTKSASGALARWAEYEAHLTGGVHEAERGTHRRAMDLADVELALQLALAADDAVPPGLRFGILVGRVVGRVERVEGRNGRQHQVRVPIPAGELAERYGVSVQAIATMVRSVMRRLRIELAARGLIPSPKRSSRIAEAVMRRREEITRRPAA